MPEGPAGAPRLTNIGPLSRSTEEEIRDGWEECPATGKESEICRAIKKASIAILEGQGVFARCDTIESINGGNCANVAFQVAGEVDGVTVLQVGDGDRFWIEFNGKHYDAEVPTGVDNPFDLPFFDRTPRDIMLQNARREARAQGREPPETIEDTIMSTTEEAR